MARMKKGQLAQFMVPMVDATDFASVESGITESDFNSGATVKFFGVDQGVSTAFTSGTVSKTARLVRSGVFQITLKGTENNYDQMMVRVNKTGAAEQIITWENVDNDDSDLMSALTVIQSMASDAASAAAQANSRVLVVQSMASDAHSAAILGASHASDAYSAVLLVQSRLSDLDSRLASDTSDILSAATAAASRALLNQSRISDVQSYLVAMSATLSDVHSAVSDTHSDLASKIAGITASVSASDISDIASAVRAILISDLSDIHSAATAGASRALLNQSRISDVYSLLSDLESNFGSRIPKEPAARSQLSDLASDLRSVLTLHTSTLSDIHSAVSDAHSDLASKIAGITVSVGASDISDIASAVRAILVSDLSDILSAAQQANSRLLVNQSVVSDIYSNLAAGVTLGASSLSDLRSAITAAEFDASDISDIASAVWARAGADPTAVPAVTGAMGDKMDWMFALSRNKLTQTATLQALYNDGGTQVASAAVSEDGTTFTREEWAG